MHIIQVIKFDYYMYPGFIQNYDWKYVILEVHKGIHSTEIIIN